MTLLRTEVAGGLLYIKRVTGKPRYFSSMLLNTKKNPLDHCLHRPARTPREGVLVGDRRELSFQLHKSI